MQEAWPFLISSSPHSDFRVVVAPEFITKANAVREIIRASDDSFRTEDGQAIYLRGHREGVGSINIVLRARTGTARMLGKNTDEPLFDGVGRPVWVSEGIVLREEGKEPFTAAQLDAALGHAQPYFARFWEDKESRKWEAVPLPSFPLPMAEGKALAITYKQSPTLPQAAPTSIEQRGVPSRSVESVYRAHDDRLAGSEAEKKTLSIRQPNLSNHPSADSGTISAHSSGERHTPPSAEPSDFSKAFGSGVVYVLGAIIAAGLCVALFVPVMALKVIGTVVAVFGALMFLKSLR
jgi:hypothetical protein